MPSPFGGALRGRRGETRRRISALAPTAHRIAVLRLIGGQGLARALGARSGAGVAPARCGVAFAAHPMPTSAAQGPHRPHRIAEVYALCNGKKL
jgi:hypothetical protein